MAYDGGGETGREHQLDNEYVDISNAKYRLDRWCSLDDS